MTVPLRTGAQRCQDLWPVQDDGDRHCGRFRGRNVEEEAASGRDIVISPFGIPQSRLEQSLGRTKPQPRLHRLDRDRHQREVWCEVEELASVGAPARDDTAARGRLLSESRVREGLNLHFLLALRRGLVGLVGDPTAIRRDSRIALVETRVRDLYRLRITGNGRRQRPHVVARGVDKVPARRPVGGCLPGIGLEEQRVLCDDTHPTRVEIARLEVADGPSTARRVTTRQVPDRPAIGRPDGHCIRAGGRRKPHDRATLEIEYEDVSAGHTSAVKCRVLAVGRQIEVPVFAGRACLGELLNGPLAKAIKGAREAIPGAPGLFVWKKNANGIWEFGMSQAIKDALARYMTVPMPD
jgi:hypothetical protein